MGERLDRGDSHLGSAADREGQPVTDDPGVGGQHHVRGRVIRIDVNGVGPRVRARGGKSQVEGVETANPHDRSRSSATAPTMIEPVTICWTPLGAPSGEQPVGIPAMIAAPAIVPTPPPLPPDRLPPPMITAAITSSSSPIDTLGGPHDHLVTRQPPARQRASHGTTV